MFTQDLISYMLYVILTALKSDCYNTMGYEV